MRHPMYPYTLIPKASAGPPAAGSASSSRTLAETAVAACSAALAERFDANRGGFGSAPKFPRPCELNLLLVYHLVAIQDGNPELAGAAQSRVCTRSWGVFV